MSEPLGFSGRIASRFIGNQLTPLLALALLALQRRAVGKL